MFTESHNLVLNAIHDRYILINLIFYPLNMVSPIQLVVSVHTKEFCNKQSFTISTIYANCGIIDDLFPTYYHKICFWHI